MLGHVSDLVDSNPSNNAQEEFKWEMILFY